MVSFRNYIDFQYVTAHINKMQKYTNDSIINTSIKTHPLLENICIT